MTLQFPHHSFPSSSDHAAQLDHDRYAHTADGLRVALFSGNYDCVRDGANRALNRLVGHLLRAGASVRVYSPTIPTPAFKSVGDVVSVRSIGIPGRSEYRIALGLPKAVRRDLALFSPNIIHLSAPDLLGRQAQAYAHDHDIPVVASLHTRFETYFDYYGLGLLRKPAERYLNRFYGESDLVLAPTQPIARSMIPLLGKDRVSIWGRGVDRKRFHPRLRDEAFRGRLGFTPDDVVPLFFGRLVKEKGLDLFVQTIARLRAEGRSVRPIVVGDGPARTIMASTMPNASFLGHLDGATLGKAVASADILINPSTTEAFGNVNLEAMASGIAVVSADVPSASALITHNRNGLLVPPCDVAAYAEAVSALIDTPHHRHNLGAMASVDADRFDWDEILHSVVQSYRRCLSRHGSLASPAPPV